MRPERKNFGGNTHFSEYQDWFGSLYQVLDLRVVTKLGHIVTFDSKSCSHAVYGGQEQAWYTEAGWREERAMSLSWIGEALANPTRVHPDKTYATNHKYLLRLPADDSTQQTEFYCAIVNVTGVKTADFITGYNIPWEDYHAYSQVMPCLYSEEAVKKKALKRGKKKKDQE